MPNWVFNKVRFYGEKEEIKELKDFVKGEEFEFDFNKILPMPEELNLTAGSEETIARSCAVARNLGKTTSEEFEKDWARSKTFDEWADLGDKYLSNLKKYKASTWYDWCWDNWGTKWNACDAFWSGDNFVSFNTAWNEPTPIFYKLSELFPKVTFMVEFANEDIGNDCGVIEYDGESFYVDHINSLEFACDVWGYDPEEFEEEECYE